MFRKWQSSFSVHSSKRGLGRLPFQQVEKDPEPRDMIHQVVGINVVKLADSQEPFAGGHVFWQPRMVWQESHLPPNSQLDFLACPAPQAVDLNITFRGRDEAGNDPEQRAFSNAVWPHDGRPIGRSESSN